ncbi:hypothetical protein Kpol_1032p55 [Vanderwaltozyma polyspora DSM 70294]|uniref:Methyltransferase type 11 domain-containing protein n=1 Tax=Vanderwaltozyma polyspora (strain ATCC 22028 / DSM 70294 / BCRC 21397 / CBS 2163 / NBRC 10782 / NRRL Y-8283 / UCD 57-17) TaxID=436907 RepID=A7TH09_VANPO|nr:uncharacterized protein Kpol_1032p55 [Vanderwaltozyma polyspora DSM 70294]EDO18461.1 hypothetical protein Kpol_1032p55 [Vanderwaltozyma polyspora DSM 70294]
MSQFSDSRYNANNYNTYRPSYPESFYEKLKEYEQTSLSLHDGRLKTLLDIGCGTGIATYQLSKNLKDFDQLIGIDASDTMIKTATEAYGSIKSLSFEISGYDKIDDKFASESIDMITCFQACHWFDFDKFVNVSWKLLKVDAPLAIVGYMDSVILEYPELDSLLHELEYGQENLGPYWDQPGRTILRSGLADFHLDETKFTDIQEVIIDAKMLRSKYYDSDNNPLIVSKKMALSDFANYLRTSSSYFTWRQKHQDSEDLVQIYMNKILEKIDSLKLSSEVTIVWGSYYKIGKKKQL